MALWQMGKVKLSKKEKIVPKKRKEESEEEVRQVLMIELLTVLDHLLQPLVIS